MYKRQEETQAACRRYSLPVYYLGHYLGAFGFCFVFGGTLRDSLWAGLLGLIIGLVNGFLNRLEVNPFFRTIAASFFMAAPAYLAASLGWMDSVDSSIIGALMILVPGLLITNSMRDIIYGDTNSGINRIVQVLLSAFAIALGTAAAWRITSGLYGLPVSTGVVHPFWVQGLARCWWAAWASPSSSTYTAAECGCVRWAAWPRGWYTCWRSSWVMVFTA